MLPMLLHVVLLASIVNVSCALVGSFLVLRRMSMMGDALSHAVLPGLVVAFLFSGSL
ncbi:MAG: metal ABC transporter permease, partial [Aeoliella sp.]